MNRIVLATCLGLLVLAHEAAGQNQPQPQPPASDEQKAREAFRAGKVDDALKLLQAAGKTNPTMSPPKVILSRWFLEANLGPQARDWLEAAAADDPDHPDVLITNASYAARDGRITDMILNCQAALVAAANPRWDADARKRYQREARLGLIQGLESRGNLASAKTELTTLVMAEPKNPQFLQRMALLNFRLNLPEEAFAELQTAYKEDPTIDPPELGMAQLWSKKPDLMRAEEWHKKAIAAHPAMARVHRMYAGFLLDRGRVEDAKVPLAETQKLEPNAPETKAMTGLLARYTRDYATATKLFEELVRDHPTFGFATASLALVLADSGDMAQKKRAVELAEVHARQNPRAPEAYAVYGYCLYRNGQIADAEKALQNAISLGPVTPDAAYFLSRLLHDKGSFEDAQKLLKVAIGSTEPFVYRKDAEAFLVEVEKKVPKKP